MNSSNPAFRKSTFEFVSDTTDTMTMSGAVNKAGILFLLLLAGAFVGWNLENILIGLVAMVIGMIASFTVIFKREWAAVGSPIYAIFDGIFIGTISVTLDQAYPGIAANAMTATFAILGSMLAAYRFGLLRATPAFTRMVVFATLSVGCVYLVDILMSFTGHPIRFMHDGGTLGVIVSLVVVGIASLNLVLDFDLFEKQAAGRAPKYMEWYCGFALLVTLVWIYIEMLRLLSKLQRR